MVRVTVFGATGGGRPARRTTLDGFTVETGLQDLTVDDTTVCDCRLTIETAMRDYCGGAQVGGPPGHAKSIDHTKSRRIQAFDGSG
jgi:hypothetical protein